VDEFLGGQGAEFGLVRVGFVTERDLVVLDLDDTAIAESDAKRCRGEILEGRASVADGFCNGRPNLAPTPKPEDRQSPRFGAGRHATGAKELGERLDREQEILAGGHHACSSLANPPAGTR